MRETISMTSDSSAAVTEESTVTAERAKETVETTVEASRPLSAVRKEEEEEEMPGRQPCVQKASAETMDIQFGAPPAGFVWGELF